MWLFKRPRRIVYKRRHSESAQEILDRLREYLDGETSEPVELLCGFWKDQQNAITYQELRELVKTGYLDEITARLWQQDYSMLVTERLPRIWGNAMIAGAANQPLIQGVSTAFTFNTQTPGVVEWMRSRGAYLVTECTQTQKDAIALLLEDSVRNSHSVDELAKLIRPTIGLTKQQTAAVRNFYDNMVKTLTEQHPRTKPESIQAQALAQTTKYAERLHRQRAMTIAQTESAYAYNYGDYEGIRQAQADHLIGRCEKRWITSGDDRVCNDCGELDGKQIGMEDLFFSGNKVEYDESGLFPPLHPRCACAVQYIEIEPPAAFPQAHRDENGVVETRSPERPATPTYGAEDVTEKWLSGAKPRSHEVEDLSEFVQDGIKYVVDGKNVILDYSPYERSVADFLEDTLGGQIFMVPKVQGIYSGVQTPDFIFRGMRFDLKTPQSANAKTFYNAIHKKRQQADNYVFDISKCGLSTEQAERQAREVFTNKYLDFVNRIILLKDDAILRIFERNIKGQPPPSRRTSSLSTE